MTYVYQYKDKAGERHQVERRYPIGKQPMSIQIDTENGPVEASLFITGGAGRMPLNWAIDRSDDGLPPVDAHKREAQ